jgi:penicillin-insensitive murein endopeptidase
LLSSPGVQWGTEELVGLLQRSALRLARDEPGAPLLVGSLSRQRGGRLPPHDSHQSGRDADLGFFMTDQEGEPTATTSFVELAPESGCGRHDGRLVCIDPRRTFQLVVALLEDDDVRVRWILMASDLRQLVLASGRRLDVPEELMHRVEEATSPR